MALALILREAIMSRKTNAKRKGVVDNDHQKQVSGKNQRGPAAKAGKSGGGNAGSKGQNSRRSLSKTSVGSHKPGGDGPGTKKFKHERDDDKRRGR
jgi:hypothetical protein